MLFCVTSSSLTVVKEGSLVGIRSGDERRARERHKERQVKGPWEQTGSKFGTSYRPVVNGLGDKQGGCIVNDEEGPFPSPNGEILWEGESPISEQPH